MIVLLLCIIMKIAEFSAGRTSPPLATMSVSARPPPLACNRRCRRCKRHRSPSSKRKHRRQSCGDKCTLRKCKKHISPTPVLPVLISFITNAARVAKLRTIKARTEFSCLHIKGDGSLFSRINFCDYLSRNCTTFSSLKRR